MKEEAIEEALEDGADGVQILAAGDIAGDRRPQPGELFHDLLVWATEGVA